VSENTSRRQPGRILVTSRAGAPRDVIKTCVRKIAQLGPSIQQLPARRRVRSPWSGHHVGGLEAFDVAVALHRRHEDVEQPEDHEQAGRHVFELGRTTQLAADGRRPAQQHRHDADERACAEDGHGEAKRAGLHFEVVALGGVVDGGDRPRDADAEEHVDGVTAGHVADRRVGVFVVDGRHLAGERVCTSASINTRHHARISCLILCFFGVFLNTRPST